jgi:cell division protein FtsL
MTSDRNFKSIVHENKTLFIIIAVILFLLELQIFAVAVIKSGQQSKLQVWDQNGDLVYETNANYLTELNKYYFEKTFGPIDQYDVRLTTREIPFPFRAWFVAAVGIPIGLVLLFAFIVHAHVSLFYGDKLKTGSSGRDRDFHETRLETMLSRVSRFNIFTIGFLIFLAVFAYWVIPNLITFLGKTGIETLTHYKMFFITVAFIFLAIIVWVIYLRYRLALKTIESRTEIEKQRLQLELPDRRDKPSQIEYKGEDEKEGNYN